MSESHPRLVSLASLAGLRIQERGDEVQLEDRGCVRYRIKDPKQLFEALRRFAEVWGCLSRRF